ncbi:MAG TPA: hypothetical protein VKC15_21490, partial [Gemmatimonadales bacterium]|nr:hypothetical protein [Gemmatimonadales bacterium]
IDDVARRLPARLRLVGPIGLALAALIVGLRQAELRRAAATAFVQGRQPAPRDRSALLLARNSRHIASLSEWVRANTTVQDRLLVDLPAGTYLYTARATVPSGPAEAGYVPSVFQYPGRYLATRILEDSITVVAIGVRGSIVRDIETVSRTCPAVLRRALPFDEIYRVFRDEGCLRTFLP